MEKLIFVLLIATAYAAPKRDRKSTFIFFSNQSFNYFLDGDSKIFNKALESTFLKIVFSNSLTLSNF
jgi:hypothetical protein